MVRFFWRFTLPTVAVDILGCWVQCSMVKEYREGNMIESLRACALFSGLSDVALQALSAIAVRRTVRSGRSLFRSGDPCTQLYVIVSGQLTVTDERGGSRVVGVIGPGEVLGTHAALGPSLHGVTAAASADAVVACLDADALREYLAGDSAAAVLVLTEVGRIIARRLRFSVDADAPLFQPGARREHDLLGDRDIPADALYGVQTLRATENFDISGVRLNRFPALIRALAQVKQACARANRLVGHLTPELAEAIEAAAEDLVMGRFHGHFVVDMIQGGAGTSTNMNVNEVIANRVLEKMGHSRGDYEHCHPNNHVNLAQSTNDVYPTALRLATLDEMGSLLTAMSELRDAFAQKANEFSTIIKMGRTQLQDAVPMTLGQEFRAFAVTINEDIDRLQETSSLFYEINLGGTAIGTGINTDPRYADEAVSALRQITGHPLVAAPDLIEATPDTGAFVMFSGVLKRAAVKLSKICNDLRLLSSGPRCGIGEIRLPPMQPGSSIMPGKVNPVIPEVVNQVAFRIVGNDLTITMAAHAGQLQLNVMEPILAFSLFESINILRAAVITLTERCVRGIEADEARCRSLVENSVGIVTAVVPWLGYERSGQVASEALRTGRSVREIILEAGDLSAEQLDRILSAEQMTAPRTMTD